MDKDQREAVFEYIFELADKADYMAIGSAESSKFQDTLESDARLASLAGEKLTRNYIKDTVLNNYSKNRRYIEEKDIIDVIKGITLDNIEGTKKELQNGIFYIVLNEQRIECTSTSLDEWHTAFKRFGKNNLDQNTKLVFLTCGGVQREAADIDAAKESLGSYGINAIIVKPKQTEIDIETLITITEKTVLIDNLIELPKPFLLLAGISGTGKSRFVRQQAELHSQANGSNYCLIPVRPDWHEPSDMLGYISRLSDEPKFIASEALRFIISAWRESAPNATRAGLGTINSDARPFWMCLDEMNLAPIEQYFADYLSVIETQSFRDGEYSCQSLIPKSDLLECKNTAKAALQLTDDDDDLWEYFLSSGVSVPPNLIVAGTVNMDETTHSFSRKVIDRAFTIDFGEFFPNQFELFFEKQPTPLGMTYPSLNSIKIQDLQLTADPMGTLSIDFLENINAILKSTPFELAYRALNELLVSVICLKPTTTIELQSVWDDFLMTKVLPRIEGDEDKLNTNASGEDASLLSKLLEELPTHLNEIWSSPRPDFFRTDVSGEHLQLQSSRAKSKIEWMERRLIERAYTSFWP